MTKLTDQQYYRSHRLIHPMDFSRKFSDQTKLSKDYKIVKECFDATINHKDIPFKIHELEFACSILESLR